MTSEDAIDDIMDRLHCPPGADVSFRSRIEEACRLAVREAMAPPSEPELAGIAERHAASSQGCWSANAAGHVYCRPAGGRLHLIGEMTGHGTYDTANAAFCASAHQDIPQLLAAVAERDGVIHDLQQDGGIEQGRREERARVVRLVRARYEGHRARRKEYMATDAVEPDLARKWAAMNEFQADTLDGLLTDLGTSPHDPLPELGTLPPDRARAEVLRLRKVLKRITVEAAYAEGPPPAGAGVGYCVPVLRRVGEMAEQALEGESHG